MSYPIHHVAACYKVHKTHKVNRLQVELLCVIEALGVTNRMKITELYFGSRHKWRKIEFVLVIMLEKGLVNKKLSPTKTRSTYQLSTFGQVILKEYQKEYSRIENRYITGKKKPHA